MLLVHCHCRDNLHNASAVHQSFRSGFISFSFSSMFCLPICYFTTIVRSSPFVQVSSYVQTLYSPDILSKALSCLYSCSFVLFIESLNDVNALQQLRLQFPLLQQQSPRRQRWKLSVPLRRGCSIDPKQSLPAHAHLLPLAKLS